MTITDGPAHGSGFTRIPTTGATVTGMADYAPLPADRILGDVKVSVVVDDEHASVSEDHLLRNYVSRLWAEDWDSDEDAVYDTW